MNPKSARISFENLAPSFSTYLLPLIHCFFSNKLKGVTLAFLEFSNHPEGPMTTHALSVFRQMFRNPRDLGKYITLSIFMHCVLCVSLYMHVLKSPLKTSSICPLFPIFYHFSFRDRLLHPFPQSTNKHQMWVLLYIVVCSCHHYH